MFNHLKRAGIVAALSIGTMTLSTTAEARDHYRDRGDDTAAIAIGAGIIGLAVGAAIASNSDRGYYDRGYYYGRPRYYYRNYPRGYYYDRYPRHYYRYDRGYDRGWDRGRDRDWDRDHDRDYHRHRGW